MEFSGGCLKSLSVPTLWSTLCADTFWNASWCQGSITCWWFSPHDGTPISSPQLLKLWWLWARDPAEVCSFLVKELSSFFPHGREGGVACKAALCKNKPNKQTCFFPTNFLKILENTFSKIFPNSNSLLHLWSGWGLCHTRFGNYCSSDIAAIQLDLKFCDIC